MRAILTESYQEPYRQEHQASHLTQFVEESEVMHPSVLQSLLREDCDDGETPGGGEGAQEADDVEGDLRDGGHGHTQHDGEEGEVDSPAVADPEEDSAEEDSKERHGGLHRVGVVYGDFPH